MGQPSVNETEIQNGMGVLPAGSRALAVVGTCSGSIAVDTPTAFGSVPALVSACGYGPAVEMAARHITTAGAPAIVCKSGASTAATSSAVTATRAGSSTSVVTVDGTASPIDSYQVALKIIAGGTRGTAGITYQTSLDGGRTYSATTALGTATTITIANSGVVLALAAGTLDAGDLFTLITTAPCPNATELGTALVALGNTTSVWGVCGIANEITGTLFDTVETKFAAFSAAGKPKAYVASFRIPTEGESESTYLAAFQTAFDSRATVYGEICAGAAQVASGVSGRAYRRPVAFVIASLEARNEEHVNIADPNLGPIVGVALNDSNGNPVYHDESINPGLDDARACVLRTWPDGPQGVFVNTPQILCSAGSDFSRMPYRRVMNLARRTARAYLIFRLNHPVRVNAQTGYILEEEAREIEAGGNAVLKAALGDAPKASGWSMVVHRDDNLLSTKTMRVDTRIIPLAYPETIIETIGYTNPALKTITG